MPRKNAGPAELTAILNDGFKSVKKKSTKKPAAKKKAAPPLPKDAGKTLAKLSGVEKKVKRGKKSKPLPPVVGELVERFKQGARYPSLASHASDVLGRKVTMGTVRFWLVKAFGGQAKYNEAATARERAHPRPKRVPTRRSAAAGGEPYEPPERWKPTKKAPLYRWNGTELVPILAWGFAPLKKDSEVEVWEGPAGTHDGWKTEIVAVDRHEGMNPNTKKPWYRQETVLVHPDGRKFLPATAAERADLVVVHAMAGLPATRLRMIETSTHTRRTKKAERKAKKEVKVEAERKKAKKARAAAKKVGEEIKSAQAAKKKTVKRGGPSIKSKSPKKRGGK